MVYEDFHHKCQKQKLIRKGRTDIKVTMLLWSLIRKKISYEKVIDVSNQILHNQQESPKSDLKGSIITLSCSREITKL